MRQSWNREQRAEGHDDFGWQAMHDGRTEAQVLASLRSVLPSALVPSVLVVLEEGEALPTTASGKTDRRRLTERMAELVAAARKKGRGGESEGQGGVEGWLEALYAEVVGGPAEARGQALLLRGGDSLAAARVLWRIKHEWGVAMTMDELQGTVAEVASAIEEKRRHAVVAGRKRMREEEEQDEEEEGQRGPTEVEERSSLLSLCESWRVNLGKCIDATPTVLEGDGQAAMVVIGSHAHVVLGVEVESGEEVWRRKVGGRVEATAARGTVEDLVFVGCHDHRCGALLVQDRRRRTDWLAD